MADKQDTNDNEVLWRSSIEMAAAACHAANAAYCRSLGDNSQPSWADAPDWQRASAIQGVEFHLANPDAGDAASHENWMKAKKAEGWKYGEEKDPEKKLHPCMVPFADLPPEQQFKDALFRTLVHSVAPALEQLEQANRSFAALPDQVKALEAERDSLKRSLTAQKGAATKAREAASAAIEASAPKAMRQFAPLKKPLQAAELEQLLADDAEKVEVAFFDEDGEEIDGMPPFELTGAKRFRRGMSGLGLTAPQLRVHGPAAGQPAFKLAGYALIVDGEVVAVKRRNDVLPIGAGSTMELKDDIVF